MQVNGKRADSNPALPGSIPGGDIYEPDPLWVTLCQRLLFVIWLTLGIVWLAVCMVAIGIYWIIWCIRAGFTSPDYVRAT